MEGTPIEGDHVNATTDPTPANLRQSVADFCDPDTNEGERLAIQAWWNELSISNHVAARLRAAELEKARGWFDNPWALHYARKGASVGVQHGGQTFPTREDAEAKQRDMERADVLFGYTTTYKIEQRTIA